ncbi:LysE family translocator [Priestia taiwanensis]|uniref:LysE family translocator n=1 Tax=Priestia taiwanensis TaxID=1347902 RepID=A0A917AMF6_9BACI|nr:LysE family translocator [Priestia taiwanensis]MBM7362296.1 threonine/homoserine/homoserine lactone efflux protein [Priestia taiwanensis]GGE61042.1 LysE family translocator [Priestia taiwanensis]
MFDSTTLSMFLVTAIVLIIIPGPDLIFTITQGMSNGRKAALATALGLSFGNIVHTLAAAFGLSLIVQTSVVVFTIFKTAGALYLFYLAYGAFTHRRDAMNMESQTKSNAKALFFRGLLMNILNPKVAIFFLTFLPQFINYEDENVPAQMMILGFIFIVLTAIIFGLLGYFAGFFRDRFLAKSQFNMYMNVTAAVIFVLLGIKLLTTSM